LEDGDEVAVHVHSGLAMDFFGPLRAEEPLPRRLSVQAMEQTRTNLRPLRENPLSEALWKDEARPDTGILVHRPYDVKLKRTPKAVEILMREVETFGDVLRHFDFDPDFYGVTESDILMDNTAFVVDQYRRFYAPTGTLDAPTHRLLPGVRRVAPLVIIKRDHFEVKCILLDGGIQFVSARPETTVAEILSFLPPHPYMHLETYDRDTQEEHTPRLQTTMDMLNLPDVQVQFHMVPDRTDSEASESEASSEP
jgi:hypothetical protein